MRRAIEMAHRQPRAPFGAVLVDIETEEVVAEGWNQVQINPVLHGEMEAIHRYAARKIDGWTRLRLYTTAEPCCMCQAAIIWAGIPEVIFGTTIKTLRNSGWKQFDLTAQSVVDHAPFAGCRIHGGVLANECDLLFLNARK